MSGKPVHVSREAVVRLWLFRQGYSRPRGSVPLTRETFVDHLERTGALQLDSVNVVDRAHYLTLWSRFGAYDKQKVDQWVYDERVAYEYWGHEASILPIAHLPLGLRRMRGFPPERWRKASWWQRFNVSTASRRRVLRRVRDEGPLESADFQSDAHKGSGWGRLREDKRALLILWHTGRLAVCRRRHFRRVYDLAERVYPVVTPAKAVAYEDSWLLTGLSGNGIASEKHMVHYWTGPEPIKEVRQRVIARNLKAGRITEVQVEGLASPMYVLPEHLGMLMHAPEPQGTTLICPFDSLLWQRQRAENLLDFTYRIEIYIPPKKRVYGYYVLPILHNGRLVGRLDPKLHRDRGVLEIRSLHLEEGFWPEGTFVAGLRGALASLATFLGATDIHLPEGWDHLT